MGVASKKKPKKGRAGQKGYAVFGPNSRGQASGYREIPIPKGVSLQRTESREIKAALRASCAENRIDPAELESRRRQELDARKASESKALSSYKAMKSRELARECQQHQEARLRNTPASAIGSFLETVHFLLVPRSD